jgi:hypothetical protein
MPEIVAKFAIVFISSQTVSAAASFASAAPLAVLMMVCPTLFVSLNVNTKEPTAAASRMSPTTIKIKSSSEMPVKPASGLSCLLTMSPAQVAQENIFFAESRREGLEGLEGLELEELAAFAAPLVVCDAVSGAGELGAGERLGVTRNPFVPTSA